MSPSDITLLQLVIEDLLKGYIKNDKFNRINYKNGNLIVFFIKAHSIFK